MRKNRITAFTMEVKGVKKNDVYLVSLFNQEYFLVDDYKK